MSRGTDAKNLIGEASDAMIQPFPSKFLTPSKTFRRLSVLMTIDSNSSISQHRIGRATQMSSSMVNNYIRELQEERLITVSGETNRTQRYHLTDGGRQELVSLFLAYSAEIIQIYGNAKNEITKKLLKMHREGISSIVLFGAAETAEVVYAAAETTPLSVQGVFDKSPARQGRTFNGFTVQAPELLKRSNADAVVITSFGNLAEIYDSIKRITGEELKVRTLSEP